MATWWVLLAIAGFFTWLSLVRYHFALSVIGMLAWFVVWGYNLNHPPTNIATTDFVYDVLYYVFLLAAFFTFLAYFLRGNSERRNVINRGGTNIEPYSFQNRFSPETPEEYRTRIRRALRRR